MLHQTEPATQSYIKALWIISANSTSEVFPLEVLATTLHCLGRTYGELGRYKEAIHLLRKAQCYYSSMHLYKDHVVMIEVQNLLEFNTQKEFDKASMKRSQHKFWSSSHSVSTLTLIVEEESE
jgi:tetratricopeptide (TPR) repeat protein